VTDERRTYRLPLAFWSDHTESRGCRGGQVVSRTQRYVTVSCDAADYVDLHTDADYYSNPATARDMADSAGSIGAYGLARSAAATLRILDADPFTPEQQAAGHAALTAEAAAEQAAWDAGREDRERRYREEREAREAERTAHPETQAEYVGPRFNHPGQLTIGVPRDWPVQPGARVRYYRDGWATLEIATVDNNGRHGNYDVTATDGTCHRIERC
jgi:hypothetical protein